MNKIIDLTKIKKIHFTGIKGVGMTALALYAKNMGMEISGSDTGGEYFVTEETLKKVKINYFNNFAAKHIVNADLVIFTGAHGGENNLEVKAAKKRGINILSQGEALGLLMSKNYGISVAGVGGKTTTSAMIATIFDGADKHPSFCIGVAEIVPLGLPGRYDKKGKYFIVEADEYFTSPQDPTPRFLYQNPEIIIITNIEFDHPDVYQNLNQTLTVFKKFIEKIPKDGLLIANIDNVNIKKLIQLTKVPIETYGFSKTADWRIELTEAKNNKNNFSLYYRGRVINNLFLSVPGKFNIKNAVAAFIAAYKCGISIDKIKQGLGLFGGTKRRFEFIKKINDVMLFDDYAHHPKEIEATLESAKEKFGKKRIIAIFQPHTYSRTKALFLDFAKSFKKADTVFITPIYASAREKNDLGISSEKLVKEIKKYHQDVTFINNKQLLRIKLKKLVKRGDVIFTIGAGDIFTWHKDIIRILKDIKI